MCNTSFYESFALILVTCDFFYPESPLQKQEVGQAVLERYLALEDEIAQAEQNSPKIALDQKKGQVETLRAKITEQQVLVEKLEEST